jgi:hypothetical protein
MGREWGPLLREDVRAALSDFGIRDASRLILSDDTEEVVLIPRYEYERIEVERLTLALMEVLPHTKVWVAPDDAPGESERI